MPAGSATLLFFWCKLMLISVSGLKDYLGITGTSEDSWLARLVAGVDRAAVRYMRREIEQQTGLTLYLSGNGQKCLYVPGRPLTTIGELRIDQQGYFGDGPDSFDDTTIKARGSYWAVETLAASENNVGRLLCVDGFWPVGQGNIRLTGVSRGYETVPDDISLACYMVCAFLRTGRKNGSPVKSERLGSYSYELLVGTSAAGNQSEEIQSAIGLLKPYREVII